MNDTRLRMRQYLQAVGFRNKLVGEGRTLSTIVVQTKWPTFIPWRYTYVVNLITSADVDTYELDWERMN